jgi:hypothetical protein
MPYAMRSTCTPAESSAPPPLDTIYCSSDIDCFAYSKELRCTQSESLSRGDNWDRRFMNFDNIAHAGLVMIRVITWDNWYYLVYELSARKVPFTTFFFILQILTVCFLSLNMFTAVVVNVFMTYRAEYVGTMAKEVEQMQRYQPEVQANDGRLTGRSAQQALAAAITKLPLSARQHAVVQTAGHVLRVRWKQLQRWYQNQVMEHSFYSGGMVALLLVNVVTLCMYYDEGFGMPTEKKDTLDSFQAWCIWMGNVELLIRFMSYKSLHAAHEGIGLLDPIINILSLIGLYAEDQFPNISIFRLFKFLRSAFVFEILYHFENVRRLYISVSKTIEMLLPLLAIMGVFTCVYGLMGMQIFGFTFVQPDGKSPRLNFDSFRNSFFTLFQVITLDDWVSIVCDGLQSTTLTSRLLIVPYLLAFVIIQCYVLLNLFVAVVVEKFELTNDTKERVQRLQNKGKEKSEQVSKKHARFLLQIHLRFTSIFRKSFANTVAPWESSAVSEAEQQHQRSIASSHQPHQESASPRSRIDSLSHRPDVRVSQLHDNDKHSASGRPGAFVGMSTALKAARTFTSFKGDASSRRALELCCFVPLRFLPRSASLWLVQHSWFDHAVLAMVISSSIFLAVESPDVTDTYTLTLFRNINFFFLAFFAAEVLLKSFALGWLMYLCDMWNVFDLVVVILMLADLTLAKDLGYVRVFRTTRVLRALKIMNKIDEIKHFIASLLDSWPELVSISLGFTVFIFLWGVIGISLFAGKTRFCAGAVTAGYDRCFGLSWHSRNAFLVPNAWILGGGVDSPYQWSGSFDDIQSSVMALFEVSTLNNWGVIRAACVDATEKLMPPVFEQNPWYSLYFIAFVFIAVFYLLNIVISTLVNTYRKKTGSAYRTEEQRLWHDMMRLSVALKPKMLPVAPKYIVGRIAFHIVHHKQFKNVSLFFNLLNAVTLSIEYSSQPKLYTEIISIMHMAITVELCIEVMLQFLAAPYRLFFTKKWNVFDLVVAVVGASFGLLNRAGNSISLGIAQTLRVVRIIRVVRVIRVSRTLQMTIMTLSMSYIYLATAMLILMICMFIFAVLAFSLFGKVKYGRALTADSTNFNNFVNSIFSLLVMTSSYEHNIVKELSVQYPYCTPDSHALRLGVGNAGDCGDPVAASLIFPVFFFLSAHFALSILSAVIVENFNICSVQHCAVFSRIKWSDFETYRLVWMMFDPYCKGRFNIHLMERFVFILGRMGSQLGDTRPSVLNIQCLKLYASRMASMHVNNSDLTWDSLLLNHKKRDHGLHRSPAVGQADAAADSKMIVRDISEAQRHISFRGLLFCLALFNAEEACLTYSESLVKHRIVQFVRRKASVQVLEEWASKQLKIKALKKKFGDKIAYVRRF